LFRDLTVLKAVEGGENLVSLSPEETAAAQALLQKVSWEDAHALFDILSRGYEMIRHASKPSSVLEMTLLKMTMLPPVLALSDIIDKVRRHDFETRDETVVRPKVEPQPEEAKPVCSKPDYSEPVCSEVDAEKEIEKQVINAQAPEPTVEEPAAEEPAKPVELAETEEVEKAVDGDSLPQPSVQQAEMKIIEASEAWRLVLASLENSSRPLWKILSAHAKLSSWDAVGRNCVITYDDPGHGFFLKPKIDEIASALKKIAGFSVSVKFECEKAPASSSQGGSSQDEVRKLRRAALSHSLVKKATELFGGEVEEVRIVKT